MNYKKYLWIPGIIALLGIVTFSCTGRHADNMVPLGETVEVVIPGGDVAEDSAVASGNTGADAVAEEVIPL